MERESRVTGPNAPLPTDATRRTFLRSGLTAFAAAVVTRHLAACGDDDSITPPVDGGTDTGMPDLSTAPDMGVTEFPMRDIPAPAPLRSLIADIGPLAADPDANGVRLPAGFTSRVVARSGQMVEPSLYEWHNFPDGGATFATEDGGWIYVSNSEVPVVGGVGAIRFNTDGTIRTAYRILPRSQVNCAGGPTPWHTWLSGEEISRGRIWECDPWGELPPVPRLALGIFKHEAAAVDHDRGHLYLTEDERDGCFYRFVPARTRPDGRPDLGEGSLELAVVAVDGAVTWAEVPDARFTGTLATRDQVATATHFNGGEGIWYREGFVYFTTKGDSRVWKYDVVAANIEVLYDGETAADPMLRGVDNITLSAGGDVLVAEDGDDMQIVAILPTGELRAIMQITGQPLSEVTGPAFDPSGTRLYFSSQRGGDGGLTYEITGPFHEPL